MSYFIYQGPLAPESALFRGRTTELRQLISLCQGELRAYAIVYGGRQTGKTSLLLRLSNTLRELAKTCRVDFQRVPGASSPEVYAYITHRLIESLPHLSGEVWTREVKVQDPSALVAFLSRAVGHPRTGRLVLMFEELGVLPSSSREDLANVLRSIFSSRFDDLYCRTLTQLMVVLAGSVELYDLAASQVSTLHNVCESIYLPDLVEAEAVGLVSDVLLNLGISKKKAQLLGQVVYDCVKGHPYLTQRFGAALESTLIRTRLVTRTDVESVIEQLLRGDPLLHSLRKSLAEQQLLHSSQSLLIGNRRFSRLDEEMARLELIGVAKEENGVWCVRNPLLSSALGGWLKRPNGLSDPCCTTTEHETQKIVGECEKKRRLIEDSKTKPNLNRQITDVQEHMEEQVTLMTRTADLEQNIRESYGLVREYEGIIQVTSDPKEKVRSQRSIAEQWNLIEGYWKEYRRLPGATVPEDIAEIVAQFSVEQVQLNPGSPATPPSGPQGGTTYVTHIQNARGIAIGDGARVITGRDDDGSDDA